MCSLNAKLHGLPWRNGGIPAHAGCTIWIAANNRRIPTADNQAASGVRPIYRPTIDIAAAIVGDANSAGKTRAPLVGDYIGATTACVCNRRAGFTGSH